MFKMLILVCSLSIAPSTRDCTVQNALDVIQGPDVPNQIMCGMNGQAYLAATTVGKLRDGEYAKLRCRPSDGADGKPLFRVDRPSTATSGASPPPASAKC